jgi:hypothetical protein
MKTHDFNESVKIGDSVEKIFDNYFKTKYKISDVSMETQFQGIDRVYQLGEQTYRIEYKGDTVTQTSGNCFIETMSNIETKRLGWALTSQADFIFYYLFGLSTALCFTPTALRTNLKSWLNQLRSVEVKNKRGSGFYYTRGVLVPMERFIHDIKPKIIEDI